MVSSMDRRALLLPALTCALAAPLALGCNGAGDGDGGGAITLRFAPMVGDASFACGQSYDGLGLTQATAQVNDFRLYIHDVTVVHGDGSREPLMLTDNDWQSNGIVLLDFEDATGECVGTPETNMEIEGEVLKGDDITGVEFVVGVPEEDNHLDSASAPAPLNIPGMYWSWMGGYKYARVEFTASGGEPFLFHLGATGCTGTTADGFTCSSDNRVTLSLDGFDPGAKAIAVDLQALVAESDMTTANDKEVDPIDGCMSGPMDPECPPLFSAMGLDHATGGADAEGQTVFRVVDKS